MSETVTQLLDRYDDDLMELARLSTQGMFDKDLYASASEARQQIVDLVAAARREVETVTQRAIRAEADLATSRAALEDVRRVEARIQAGNAPDLPEHSIAGLVNARYGAIVRWEDEETTVATGDSLEALGRALAQEAGDAMR